MPRIPKVSPATTFVYSTSMKDGARRVKIAATLRQAADQIISDGLRLKTQADMANALVKEAEGATIALLAAHNEIKRLNRELLEAQG